MKAFKTIGILLIGALFINACSSPKASKLKEITTLEDELFSDESQMINRTEADKLIGLYVAYADEFPTDTEAAPYLFKAGDMAMNLNMPRKAIIMFDRILTDYSDYEKTPQCLFLKGYVFENNLGDLAKAKQIYEEFLEKYPDDEFADDAEVSIRNLGKSPEELIKEFEEKSKEEGSI